MTELYEFDKTKENYSRNLENEVALFLNGLFFWGNTSTPSVYITTYLDQPQEIDHRFHTSQFEHQGVAHLLLPSFLTWGAFHKQHRVEISKQIEKIISQSIKQYEYYFKKNFK